jgi:dipeptide/tripeptide permease
VPKLVIVFGVLGLAGPWIGTSCCASPSHLRSVSGAHLATDAMDTTQALLRRSQGTELGIQTDLTQVLLAFALLLARILPVIIITPFLGGESVPQEVKLGLGVLVGAGPVPLLIAQTQVRDVPSRRWSSSR